MTAKNILLKCNAFFQFYDWHYYSKTETTFVNEINSNKYETTLFVSKNAVLTNLMYKDKGES